MKEIRTVGWEGGPGHSNCRHPLRFSSTLPQVSTLPDLWRENEEFCDVRDFGPSFVIYQQVLQL
jgi:hypothetical protein